MAGLAGRWLAIFLALGLVGCADTSAGQQTLVAHEESMQTRQFSLRATSTSSMEELLLTLDNAEIMSTRMSERQLNLIATLDARGILINLPPTQIPIATFIASPTPAEVLDPNFTGTPQTLFSNVPIITLAPTDVIVTPFAPTLPPTPIPPTQSLFPDQLREIVFASAVGDDDCATAPQTTFASSAQAIYIVARAYNISAGMTIRADWSRDGVPLTSFDFTPDFSINGECIWFFADQTDFAFTPGAYQVTLYVGAVQAAEPAAFTITG